ncbi:DNRLRE domain-containing protein [Streptomyces sp. B6B3]|uniref:CBM96 family carbohydrate-binding protein n=1 Tax=Streptomyces sp. B6B3 TaxID=3153570 RepID=UPI00325F7EAE
MSRHARPGTRTSERRFAQRRRPLAYGATLLLTAGALGSITGASAPSALTPPLSMTADTLPTWQTNGIVYSMAEANGVVFVGGTFSTIRPPGAAPGTQEQEAVNFVAFDAATGQPTDCELSFTVGSGTAQVRALAVSPDKETLYVGGTFGTVGTPSGSAGASSVAAIDIDSCTRVSFGPAANGIVRSIAATEDRVYLGGDFTEMSGESHSRFAAVDTSGEVLDWEADADEVGKAVEVTPDGQHVLLGGDFFEVNNASTHGLAVVSADTGDVEQTYSNSFIGNSSTIQDITTDENGFYVGAEGSGGGVFDGRIALSLDTFDEVWRDTCLGATQGLAVHQEVLYSAHHAHDCSSMGEFPDQPRYHLFGQSVFDPQLLGWFPNTNDGLGEALGPRVLAVAEDVPDESRDFLWVGGGFTTVNGVSQWGLTRFASSPDNGDPSVPETHAASIRPGEIDLTWRASQDMDDSLITYNVYRDGGSQPIHTVSEESLPWSRPQLTFTDTGIPAGESHSYRITATDGAGNVSALSPPVTAVSATSSQPYVDAVLADDPLLYWRYDEPANDFASDASGNGNSGVHKLGVDPGTTPPAVQGPNAAAATYDGVDSYTYGDDVVSGVTRFSLETWFRTTSTEGGKLIGLGDRINQESYSHDNNVYMLDDGELQFTVYNGSYRTATSDDEYNDGEWHHLVASVGSAGMELYVDGERVDRNTRITSGRNLNGYYWHTGGDSLDRFPNQPDSDYFAGQLDETAIYGSQLSGSRVDAHYEAASAPTDTVTQVTASADTYVNGSATTTNYGGHQQLAVRGSSPYESYLSFDLPTAPEGTVLKGAALRVRVGSEAISGSTDSFQVVPITGDWTESGTTYATRPSLGEPPVGTLSSPDAAGGVYTVPLDTATVAAGLGGSTDMALVGGGTDSLWLYSSEASQTGYQPELVLTFGSP